MWWLRPGTSCGVFHQIVSFSVAASTFWRPIIPGIDRESHRCEAPSRDTMIPTLIWKVLGKSCKSHSGQTIHRQNFSPTFSLMCIYIWLSTVQYTINTLSALRRVLALCIILRVRIDVFEADPPAPLWSYLKRFIALFNCFVFSFVLCAVFSPPPRFPLPVSLLLSCIWWFLDNAICFLIQSFLVDPRARFYHYHPAYPRIVQSCFFLAGHSDGSFLLMLIIPNLHWNSLL